jgi:hypothetical protein
MARNKDRDRLIQTFLSRNRRTTTPGYRPMKQGTLQSKVSGTLGQPPSPKNVQNLEAAKQYAVQSAARKRIRRPAKF